MKKKGLSIIMNPVFTKEKPFVFGLSEPNKQAVY
jgi:hypothetical protein